jgi:Chromosome segregation ATPases
LQQEKQKLDTQKSGIEEKMAAAVHDLETEYAHGSQLDQQLQTEQATLIQEQKAIASKFQETAQKKQESEATRAELARLTAELVKLEQTVADLKSLRQKQQRTYSLVPYRGRRGDNRRPIYVECTASSLIFHPDRWTLPATDSGGSAILAEVDRRIRRQQSADGDTTEKQTPYLLLLVRPDGIMTYYRTLQSLRGLQLDFGYEFVEPDWVLSFPENESAAGTQPWIAADSPGDDSPSRRRNRSARSLGGALASGVNNGPGDGDSGASDRPGDPGSKGSGPFK